MTTKEFGLPTNYRRMNLQTKKSLLLRLAYNYPSEYKYLPLSELWNIDRALSEQILSETEGDSEKINNFLQKYFAGNL